MRQVCSYRQTDRGMIPGLASLQAAYDAAQPDNTDACEPCQDNDCPEPCSQDCTDHCAYQR